MIPKAPYLPTTPETARKFMDATEAVEYIRQIYDANTAYLREMFERLTRGEKITDPVLACYPYVAITTYQFAQLDTRLSYGFVSGPGRHSTTLTRPDIFRHFYKHQFTQLLNNHKVPLEVGISTCPIPLHFAFHEGIHVENGLTQEQIDIFREHFTLPDLSVMDDDIANGTYAPKPGDDKPLALFTAPRTDYSLHRLRHYTGTDPIHFQNFILFTNYPFYMDSFVKMGLEKVADPSDPHICLVQPGNHITRNKDCSVCSVQDSGQKLPNVPQMPAYHLVREDGCGITIINIGVGPSNARNISDHVAVLRPDAWLMLGHCAGLRKTQRLGDYVLAHGYVRDDHALDDELPLWIPIPALAEVQKALEHTVATMTGQQGYDLKSVMRTGTVVSTGNRNWEISDFGKLVQRFNQSRAIALDMESAVIAANGFRYRVPYGTLLCVSDRPLHGEIKLPGMANSFYKQQVNQHLQIGLNALDLLRERGRETLHSRKLRGFVETAFQ